MKLRDILKLGLYLSISGTLVIGSPVHAATVKRKAKPASARKATPPKLSDTEVLSRQLVASRFVDDADLSECTPKRFSYLAAALNMNRELLNSAQGEFESSEDYTKRRAELATVMGAESMVICEPLDDNSDVNFKYNPDRQTFDGSLSLDHNIYNNGKDLGSYRAKTAMGVTFTVSASVDINYDLSLKILGKPSVCFDGSSYNHKFTVPAILSAAPGIKVNGKIAYVVRLIAPYVSYDQSSGNPRLDHPYDRYVHTIKGFARLEKVMIVDGANQIIWTCETGVLGASQAPKPAGDPSDWISRMDYPIEAYSKKLSGTVSAKLFIDENGAVSGCEVVVSSGSPVLDDSTCAGWKKRAAFLPATDVNSLPIAGTFTIEKTWTGYGR